MILVAIAAPSKAYVQSEIVNVTPEGDVGNGVSAVGDLSQTGRYVAFASAASDLVEGDDNGWSDVFVRDMEDGTTVLVSRRSDGSQANDYSSWPSISSDGRTVSFISKGQLTDEPVVSDSLYVHHLESGKTEFVSVNADGDAANDNVYEPDISGNGRFVAFATQANNLIRRDTNETRDIYVRDLEEGTTTRVSVGGGKQSRGHSESPSISDSGRYVAFISSWDFRAKKPIYNQAFVRDRKNKTTEMVSLNSQGEIADDLIFQVEISGNGRYVVFSTDAQNFFKNDDPGSYDVFVYDRRTDTTTPLTPHGEIDTGDDDSQDPTISHSGRFIGFYSDLSLSDEYDSDPSSSRSDIFVYDQREAEMLMVTGWPECPCSQPHLSGDGRFVGFYGDYQAYRSNALR